MTRCQVSRGVPIQMLGRNFVRQDGGWLIRRALREAIDFRRISMVDAWPAMPPLDLVVLRDVLIYLEEKARENALAELASRLRPGGMVVLGPSDSPMEGEAWEDVPVDGLPVFRRRA